MLSTAGAAEPHRLTRAGNPRW